MSAISDPLFHEISLQLIDPPQASISSLLAARTAPPVVDPRFGFLLAQARSWVDEMLAAPWRPPEDTVFLLFPKEAGGPDVLRATYKAGGMQLDVAQTRYLVSIKVRGFAEPGGEPAATLATSFVRELTGREPERIRLVETEKVDGRTIGHQDFAATVPRFPGWPDWLEALRWWIDPASVGILTVKLPGGPTQEAISGGADENRVWFSALRNS